MSSCVLHLRSSASLSVRSSGLSSLVPLARPRFVPSRHRPSFPLPTPPLRYSGTAGCVCIYTAAPRGEKQAPKVLRRDIAIYTEETRCARLSSSPEATPFFRTRGPIQRHRGVSPTPPRTAPTRREELTHTAAPRGVLERITRRRPIAGDTLIQRHSGVPDGPIQRHRGVSFRFLSTGRSETAGDTAAIRFRTFTNRPPDSRSS